MLFLVHLVLQRTRFALSRVSCQPSFRLISLALVSLMLAVSSSLAPLPQVAPFVTLSTLISCADPFQQLQCVDDGPFSKFGSISSDSRPAFTSFSQSISGTSRYTTH